MLNPHLKALEKQPQTPRNLQGAVFLVYGLSSSRCFCKILLYTSSYSKIFRKKGQYHHVQSQVKSTHKPLACTDAMCNFPWIGLKRSTSVKKPWDIPKWSRVRSSFIVFSKAIMLNPHLLKNVRRNVQFQTFIEILSGQRPTPPISAPKSH